MEGIKPTLMKDRPRANSFIEADVNPFVQKIQFTWRQKLQIALMSISIAPLRIILFHIVLVLTWLLGLVVTLGMDMSMKKPASHFRIILFNIIRKMGRLCLFCVGFHSVTVRGKRASAKEAPILVVAPHSSLFDVIVMFLSDPLPSGVSRIENYQTPFIGKLSKTMQPVFVSRSDPDSRKNTILEIKRRVASPGKWPQIIIFPEGTCTNRKALITFKAGAFIPGAAVQPVIIEFLNDLDTVTWTMTGLGTLEVIWYSLCQFSIKARVTYLPVYKPSEKEKTNPKAFAKNVRLLMADSLGIPSTDHTFEDCRLMRKAELLKLPMESGLVEFAKISKKLGMDIDSIQDKLQEFAKIASQRSDGLVSIENFAKFLNLPISPALTDMFRLYDRNDSGFIDFREYVIGLSLVSQPAVTKDTIELAFKVFDKDGNGMITEDEFSHILQAAFNENITGSRIFSEIKKSCSDRITFNEFYDFVKKRPEYASMFVWYKEMMQDAISDPVEMSASAEVSKKESNEIICSDLNQKSKVD